MIPPGGFLGRHLDAEFHPLRNWKRTHSVVLFVDEWNPDWGGQLNLEGHSKVTPSRNCAVVFETQSMWHEVLPTSKDAAYRRTIALFAWSQVHAEEVSKNRSANFSV
jgi:Rps23 Pro-64 3,4-dihydroxylase Tpa1-like proline 4-hydroxylase